VEIFDNIAARITGPLSLRFIIQPIIAIILAVRDGRIDAKAGTPPFVYDLVFDPSHRSERLLNALHAILIPVIIGTVADGIAQYMIFQHVRPIPAILVGALVIGIPYALVRGLINRIFSNRYRRK
jgi:hypothetical protein